VKVSSNGFNFGWRTLYFVDNKLDVSSWKIYDPVVDDKGTSMLNASSVDDWGGQFRNNSVSSIKLLSWTERKNSFP